MLRRLDPSYGLQKRALPRPIWPDCDDRLLFTNLQVVITILVMTFFSPCVNALLVLFKERGFRTGLAIIGFVLPYSVALGGFLHWILRSLNVTFR